MDYKQIAADALGVPNDSDLEVVDHDWSTTYDDGARDTTHAYAHRMTGDSVTVYAYAHSQDVQTIVQRAAYSKRPSLITQGVSA